MTHFTAAALDGLGEPVRRYFQHAIAEGTPLHRGVRLTMRGRIKIGAWLPFTAEETCDGTSFEWHARVGPVLTVVDRYAHGAAGTEGRLFGRRTLFRSDDAHTIRSAAGRAALEAIWAPMSLLPGRGVTWRVEADDLIAAAWDIPPERPEIHIRIDEGGAVRSVWAQRWNADEYLPCGCDVHAERSWGNLTVPSRLTVGWRFGTPGHAPFFRCELETLAAEDR